MFFGHKQELLLANVNFHLCNVACNLQYERNSVKKRSHFVRLVRPVLFILTIHHNLQSELKLSDA